MFVHSRGPDIAASMQHPDRRSLSSPSAPAGRHEDARPGGSRTGLMDANDPESAGLGAASDSDFGSIAPDAGASGTDFVEPVESAPYIVLHVDDEPYVLSAVRRILHPAFRVLTAESGAAGLELLSQHDVHLVISDQRMPGMTGTEFLARVRTLYPVAVRVMLSGYCDVHSIAEAMRASSVYRFVPKPWNERELLHVVSSAVRFGVNDREWRRTHAPC